MRVVAQMGDQCGIFEDSAYGEIDGIPSQAGAVKYRQDISEDDSRSVFERAEEMNRFNKEGTIYKLEESGDNDLLGSIINNQ